jgi:glycosyltransferase involved in cell wall biosynthesis
MLKFSIITPTFNSGHYLKRAIESVLAQDYRPVEHIVVDGGSQDETVQLLEQYPHITWISEPDQGQSDAMNKGFAMANGDIIGYLNADDWYEPGVFSTVADTFKADSDTMMVVGDFFVQKKGKTSLKTPHIDYEKTIAHHRYLFPGNPVSYFYKRAIQEIVGDFPVDNHYAMDYWFLLETFRRFAPAVKKIDLPLGYFFYDGNNKTSTISPIKLIPTVVRQHLLDHRDYPRLVKYTLDYWYFINKRLFTRRLSALKKRIYATIKWK